jgi:glycosyltransferase involved in cell wall biosynthesis
MLANLALGLISEKETVDFITDNPESNYLEPLKARAVIKSIKGVHRKDQVDALAEYISKEKPSWVLVSKEGASRIALEARKRASHYPRIALRVATTHSAMTRRYFLPKRLIKLRRIRKLCGDADLIIAVSRGVAEDISKIAKLPLDNIAVAPNPVVTENMTPQANESVKHEWFSDSRKRCVILGAGRFSRAKDFPNLIRAFAELRKKIVNSKLLILGDGRQRRLVERTARKLGISDHVSLPGFNPNPYPYFAKADIFVLSSKWEGLPGALIEALALGTPVVSTDCPSGPREILQNGRYGPLVPPGDPSALAQAILETLAKPLPTPVLKEAALPYSVKNSTKKYLEAMQSKTLRKD